MDDELKLVTKLRNRAINKRAKGHYSPSTIALEDEAASAILALRQRAEQAERDNDRSFQTLSVYGVPKDRAKNVANGISVLMARIDRERDALRKDAERYRWFRASKNTVAAQEMFECCCEDHLDGEIDAALKRK